MISCISLQKVWSYREKCLYLHTKNIKFMEAAVFNPTQIHLLKMFSYAKTDAAFEEIKKALSLYFAKRVSDDMDALWDSGEWFQEKNEAVLDEHLRTPYKQ